MDGYSRQFGKTRSRTGIPAAWQDRKQEDVVLIDAVNRNISGGPEPDAQPQQIENEATDKDFELYRYHGDSGLKPPRRTFEAMCVSWAQKLVVREANPWRKAWSIILFILLVYTGTLFPYRLCFLEFKIPDGEKVSSDWTRFEIVVDVLFWIDLVLNFFFTYTDAFGNEKDDICSIVVHYLCGYFALNLVACLPDSAVEPVFGAIASSDGHEEEGSQSTIHKMTRISRLQRTTRLARLARLVRLARIARLVAFIGNSPTWKWLQGMRGMRVVNFVIFLFWIVHILACGWYLCAALHIDVQETWVARRSVDVGGTSLLMRGSLEAWAHSCYFVFTVFTTVGFGDMSAMTTGEIVYVMFTMLVGAVVHSIIVSEMINILTFLDATQIEMQKHREVVDGFTKHTHLDPHTHARLRHWIEDLVQEGMLSHQYDREVMREILTGGHLPHNLLNVLPERVFQGRLAQNKFITTCLSHSREVPPRLSLLIALNLVPRGYIKDEVVYSMHDHPFNIYLVQSGVFAFVGAPGPHGGSDESPIVADQNGISRASVYAVRMMATRRGSKNRSGHSTPTSNKSTRTVATNHKGVMSREATVDSCLTDGKTSLSGDTVQEAPLSTFSSTLTERTRQLQKYHTEAEGVVNGPKLFPYHLFCSGTYFGSLELLDAGARRCTARCEGKTRCFKTDKEYGPACSLLLLHKQEFNRILEEFPHYRNAWVHSARRDEIRRLERRSRLTKGRDYLGLAASEIQAFVRARKNCLGVSMHLRAKVKLKPTEPAAHRKTVFSKKAPGLQLFRESLQSELRSGLEELRLEMRSNMAEMREAFAHSRGPRDSFSRRSRHGSRRNGSAAASPEPDGRAGIPNGEVQEYPLGIPPGVVAADALEPSERDELIELREEVARLRRELSEERKAHRVTLQDQSNLRWLAQMEQVTPQAPTMEPAPLEHLPSDTEEC